MQQHAKVRACRRRPASRSGSCTATAMRTASARRRPRTACAARASSRTPRRGCPRASSSRRRAPCDSAAACVSAITQPCLPSQSPSSTESASASQLLPKCSGSLSPFASAASSSALLSTVLRSARDEARASPRRRRPRAAACRRSTRGRRRSRGREDRAPSFADPPERLVVVVGVVAGVGRARRAAADDAPRAAVLSRRACAPCTRDNSRAACAGRSCSRLPNDDAVAVVAERAAVADQREDVSRASVGRSRERDRREARRDVDARAPTRERAPAQPRAPARRRRRTCACAERRRMRRRVYVNSGQLDRVRRAHLDVQVAQLLLGRPALGASTSRSWPRCVFGKRDHVADRLDAGHHRDHAVEAERDAAVRRRAVRQRVEQEAELAAAGPRG